MTTGANRETQDSLPEEAEEGTEEGAEEVTEVGRRLEVNIITTVNLD